MFVLLLSIYVLLWHDRSSADASRDWTRYAWVAAMAASVVFTMLSTLHRERAVRQEYAYPALSPDGRWMAYSRLDHGAWNLWLRDEGSGATRRIADVPCNQIEPSWEGDSKTLLYGTDCGRSLWFTAIARRQVVH